MNTTLLEVPSDLDWLFETHLQPFNELRPRVKIAILHGNEDAPQKVFLHDVNDMRVPPMAEFGLNEVGNLVRTDEALDHEFAFDVKLDAAIRFKAKSEEHARAALREMMQCVDANLGEILGQTIVCEVSLNDDPVLYEVDGKSVD
jgi:hypothetical protein